METRNPFQSSQADIEPAVPGQQRSQDRNLLWLLFSFQGRIPRSSFWVASLLAAIVVMVALFVVASVIFMTSGGKTVGVVRILFVPFYIGHIWVSLALQVKRWHDRNMSGWWSLINLIPFIGPLFAFVQIGLLRGTEGPNQYGDDPTPDTRWNCLSQCAATRLSLQKWSNWTERMPRTRTWPVWPAIPKSKNFALAGRGLRMPAWNTAVGSPTYRSSIYR